MNSQPAVANRPRERPNEPFQVVVATILVVAVAAGLTLHQVLDPGVRTFASENPTPRGYTWSLALFLIPLGTLGV